MNVRTVAASIVAGDSCVELPSRITRSRPNSMPRSPSSSTGIVTKVDWTNPHVWFYINVKDEATGEVTNWGAEMGPPHGLQRSGWRRETLKIGESVSVDGFLARNGEKRMNARTVTLTSTGGRPGKRSTPTRAPAKDVPTSPRPPLPTAEAS